MSDSLRNAVPLAITLLCAGLLTAPSSASDGEKAKKAPVDCALAYFEGLESTDLDSFLERMRPPRLSAAARTPHGARLKGVEEARPTAGDLDKLAVVDPVLRYHDRQEVIEVRLIDAPYAVVGLCARTLLLISREALREISPQEVQAVAAHELGHEYFWDEYQKAVDDGNDHRVRELELRCDGIAVLTLCRLGLDPRHLTQALIHLTRYNEQRGAPRTTGPYPSLSERADFIKALTRSLECAAREP